MKSISLVTKMTVALISLVMLSATTVTAGLITGQAVNVDLSSKWGGAEYSSQGALTTPGNNWNYFEGQNWSSPASNLNDSESGSTDVGFSLEDYQSAHYYDYSNDLLDDYFFLGDTVTGPVDLTISSLDADTPHDLYIYSQGEGSGQGGKFTVGGTTKSASGNPVKDTFEEGVNYVAFHDITPDKNIDGSGEITVTWERLSGEEYGPLNGFQVKAVPEPSTLALLGLAGLLLMRRRRL